FQPNRPAGGRSVLEGWRSRRWGADRERVSSGERWRGPHATAPATGARGGSGRSVLHGHRVGPGGDSRREFSSRLRGIHRQFLERQPEGTASEPGVLLHAHSRLRQRGPPPAAEGPARKRSACRLPLSDGRAGWWNGG